MKPYNLFTHKYVLNDYINIEHICIFMKFMGN